MAAIETPNGTGGKKYHKGNGEGIIRIRIIASLSILNLNSVKHQLAVGEIPRTARTPSRARPKGTEPRPSNFEG